LYSCQKPTVIEEETPSGQGKYYVHFYVPDSTAIPDSIWYRSPADSGTGSGLGFQRGTPGLTAVFFPDLRPLGKDSLAIHSFRMGLHTGVSYAKQVYYMELSATRIVRSGADSLALSLLRLLDSTRKASPKSFPDTSANGKRSALVRLAADLVYQGHPGTAAYRRTSPSGLDTASVNRQILTLAAKSGLTLAEVVKKWNLRLDYQGARRALASMDVDTQSLNPFSLARPLQLDTLHLGEPGVGLQGTILGRKGIRSLTFSITNDSGDRIDHFVLSDLPATRTQPASLDLDKHPAFSCRPNASLGFYLLGVTVDDSLGNIQTFTTRLQVAAALDHQGPRLELVFPRDSSLVTDYLDSLLNIQVRAQDPSGIQSVMIDGKSATAVAGSDWSVRVLVPRQSTSRVIVIVATDSAGNEARTQILVRRNDPKSPALELVEPAQNSWIAFDTSKVMVSWKADPGTGTLDSVWIDNARATCDAQNTCQRLVSVQGTGKLVTIPVKAWNSVGLTRTDNAIFGRKADTTGPTAQWVSPVPGTQIPFDISQVDVVVSASDPSGVDSVDIAGHRARAEGGQWKRTVTLGQPGEITRIPVRAWDHAGNTSDSVFMLTRAPVPSSLPPSATWLNPNLRTGTVLPFDSTGLWVKVRLFDLSGIDTASVKIGGKPAQVMPDSVWMARIGLPANGIPQVIALEVKNVRGVRLSDLATVTRRQDTVRSLGISDTVSRLRSGSFWVKLACATPGAIIRFTLDGTDPTELSPKFKDSLLIDTTLTLKAKGFATDRVSSATTVQKYQLALPVEVIGGWPSTLFRLSDGSLWGTGFNKDHRISPLTPPPDMIGNQSQVREFFVRPSKIADSVIQAHSFDGYSHWIKSDHTLWGIGLNSSGQLGDGTFQNRSVPVLIARDIAKVTSMTSTLVLKTDSTLWITGPYSANRRTNQLIQIANHVRGMIAGINRSWILRNDGSLWSMRHDVSLTTETLPPLEFVTDSVETLPPYQTDTNQDGLLFLKKDGTVWGYGQNRYGILGTGDRLPVPTPIHLSSFDGLGIQQISMGETIVLFTSRSGDVYATGTNTGGEIEPMELLRPGLVQSHVSSAFAGVGTCFYLFQNGSLYGQGFDEVGQLGTGILTQQSNDFTRIRF